MVPKSATAADLETSPPTYARGVIVALNQRGANGAEDTPDANQIRQRLAVVRGPQDLEKQKKEKEVIRC